METAFRVICLEVIYPSGYAG